MKQFFFILCLLVGVNTSYAQQPEYIKSIYFGGGDYVIDELQIEELHKFLDDIPNIEAYRITIHSHTDNIGGASYNEWLSKMRSEAAVEQLLLREIMRQSIEIKDFGQFNPVYDNSTWIGRMKNRRVDILFWPLTM